MGPCRDFTRCGAPGNRGYPRVNVDGWQSRKACPSRKTSDQRGASRPGFGRVSSWPRPQSRDGGGPMFQGLGAAFAKRALALWIEVEVNRQCSEAAGISGPLPSMALMKTENSSPWELILSLV